MYPILVSLVQRDRRIVLPHAADEPRTRPAGTIEAIVRVYGSLNDFLPPCRRQIPWLRAIDRPTTVKDRIEGLGVPHPEIDLVLANGTSVPFDYMVRTGDRITVFPRLAGFDTAYGAHEDDTALADTAVRETMVLLTRD